MNRMRKWTEKRATDFFGFLISWCRYGIKGISRQRYSNNNIPVISEIPLEFSNCTNVRCNLIHFNDSTLLSNFECEMWNSFQWNTRPTRISPKSTMNSIYIYIITKFVRLNNSISTCHYCKLEINAFSRYSHLDSGSQFISRTGIIIINKRRIKIIQLKNAN